MRSPDFGILRKPVFSIFKFMQLHLYDTLSREIQPVLPMDGHRFRFYCCGPTVYGPAHIGNFRTFVVQDLFRRVLEGLGMETLHVRNITDVDDKTIRQSQAEGVTLEAFARKWTETYHKDCGALNVSPPHVEPSAVAHITEQIALIQTLLEKGVAYVSAEGSVYYRVDAWSNYGKLSRVTERSLRAAANDADEYEREQVADFALWKAWKSEDGPNAWDSPWGRGRPGWHIECSAMAMKYLGESFDLHSGGVDLIFPHHENEIAQSEAATGKPFARHWFHIAHLLVDGRKMSKSLGNLYTLGDVAARGYSPEALRLTLLNGHYRQPSNFTWDRLEAAEKMLGRLRRIRESLPEAQPAAADTQGPFRPVWEALCQDLNVPEALGRLFLILREKKPSGQEDANQLDAVCRALGLTAQPKEQVIPSDIQDLAQRRWKAKREKNYAFADQLRDELARSGWEMRDQSGTYTLRPC